MSFSIFLTRSSALGGERVPLMLPTSKPALPWRFDDWFSDLKTRRWFWMCLTAALGVWRSGLSSSFFFHEYGAMRLSIAIWKWSGRSAAYRLPRSDHSSSFSGSSSCCSTLAKNVNFITATNVHENIAALVICKESLPTAEPIVVIFDKQVTLLECRVAKQFANEIPRVL